MAADWIEREVRSQKRVVGRRKTRLELEDILNIDALFRATKKELKPDICASKRNMHMLLQFVDGIKVGGLFGCEYWSKKKRLATHSILFSRRARGTRGGN
jgi:hypothetical protein